MDTISSVVGDAVSTVAAQLWLIAPIGLGIFGIMWGVPKGKQFLKKLAG